MVTYKSAKERFLQSCIIGDLDTIKSDLFYNVSPFIQDKYGNNALHLTCMNNQPKVLEYLLKIAKIYKHDVPNKLGRTALNIAASCGAFECIDILLKNLHCDINSTDKNFKNTPLHWCVTSRCTKGVEILLNWGADFMLVNKFGKTPMELAKETCMDILHLIDNFVKNKNNDQYSHTNCQTSTSVKLSSNGAQYKASDAYLRLDSNILKKTVNRQNNINETILGIDLTSINSNESYFLDISKLKHGDNSVLKLLEKSIEPVDETSFVSSILNSGKVIQLTEAGKLALEYTKNEVNTPIPNRLVKSFLTTSQQYSENENHSDNKTYNKDNTFDSKKTLNKRQKRLKNPQICSKKIKYAETTTNELSGSENPMCTKTVPRVYKSNSNCLQSSSSVENISDQNNKDFNKNQLVCLNPDISTQSKWVEDLMCLLHKLDNPDFVEQIN